MRVCGRINPDKGAYMEIDPSLWENTYDSSWIARDLTQSAYFSQYLDVLSQIGQLGINLALVLYGIFYVYLLESE